MLGLRAIARVAIAALLRRGNGVTIFVPVDTVVTPTSYAPSVASGASVGVPADTVTPTSYTPIVSTSANIQVPVDAVVLTDYASFVASGARVAVPADMVVSASYAPRILSGVNVKVPVSEVITDDPVLEINARRRRVKTQIIQS